MVKIKKNSQIITVTVHIKCLILEILNTLRLIPKIMKYCHDCLTPIKSDSKEEYCTICKRDRALKESNTS